MPLTKKQVEEARNVYDLYWESYQKGDVDTLASTLHDNYEMIGTTESEICHNKAEGIEFFKGQAEEVVGKAEMRNRQINAMPVEGMVLINELCDIYVLAETDWNFYSIIRISTFLRETSDGWKVVQQHGSLPDNRVQKGETLAIDKISRENIELRDAVNRRTAELENKNRELEIEAALERIRSSSMAMQKPDDLRDVVTVLFEQMQELSVDMGFASVSIFIFEEGTRDFTQWLPLPDGVTSLHVPYIDHPISSDLFDARESGTDYFEKVYSVEEKNAWAEKGFELTDYKNLPGEFKTSLLEAPGYAMSISLAKHSGICIPSFEGKLPSPENVAILKRVGKVFEQAYNRFLDIKKAEEQSKEARIETALERVRSRSLAMHHSSELSSVVDTLLQEFTGLDFTLTFCIINLIDGDDLSNTVWAANPETGKDAESYYMKFEDYDFHRAMWNAWKARDKRFVYVLEGEEKKIYDEYLYSETEFRRFPKHVQEANKTLERYVAGFTFFKYSGLQTVSVNPILEEELAILERFGKVFEQAYIRFLDLQKAEAQAREAKIETALEKVRSRSLAMHKSDELNEVVKVLFEKMTELQVPSTAVAIQTFTEGSKDMQVFVCGDVGTGLVINQYLLPYFDHPIIHDYLDTHNKNQDFFVGSYTKKEKDSFYDFVLRRPELKDLPAEVKTMIRKSEVYEVTMVPAEKSLLAVNDFQGNPLSESQVHILKRFAKVFDQAYTRFLDLKKAEAQAKEAKIEAALEKVRSRSLAMHKSEELVEVDKVIIEQIKALDIDLFGVGIHICHEDEPVSEAWMGDPTEGGLFGGDRQFPKIIFEHNHDSFSELMYRGWKQGESFLTETVHGDRLKEHMGYVSSIVPDAAMPDSSTPPELLIYHLAYFSQGFLVFVSTTPRLDEYTVFIRLAKVFEQAYTRFLDLKKAEAQAQEAQIQLALERVRAKTMAMQTSAELADTAAILFKQLSTLGIAPNRLFIIIFNEETGDLEAWGTEEDGKKVSQTFKANIDQTPVFQEMFDGWEERNQSLIIDLKGNKLTAYIRFLSEQLQIPVTTGHTQKRRVQSVAYFAQGLIGMASPEPQPDEIISILERFAMVFDQTYTRFLDLKKAEEQARESQVNLAVERVRARALAMFKSEEILDVVYKLKEEIMGLDIPNVTAATIHLKEPDGKYRAWDLTSISEDGNELEISLDIRWHREDTHPDFFMREVWDRTEDYFVVIQGGDRYKHTVQWLHQNGHSDYAEEFEEFLESSQLEKAYHPTVPLNNGRMCIDILEPPDPEVESILKKMAEAFNLAYKRFEDLQKAEAQTREVQIEAALERARAQSMMMQHSDEINSISNAFHEQLVLLGIPSEFSYVWLPDEENQSHQFWASWYEIKAGDETLQSKQVTYPLDKSEPYTAACFAAWATPDVILEEFIPPQDITGFFDVWQELLSGAKKLKAEYFPEGIYYSETYMRYGCFGINIRRKLSEEEKNILKRFSKEFERAYTRFLDLQKAEEQALLIREERDRLEIALNKLEATQDQLIQQEKLASLGQLTAGIAHEIKNPLNFVNNFSDVSIELVQEAREEVLGQKSDVKRETEDGRRETEGSTLSRGEAGSSPQMDLILEILDDIEANLRKIHEHGSRADSIVKSMLQHSRGGDGKMEPTPLNPIIKEYVNLAFHGMRAGNEPINVDIDLQLDENVGEVPLVAEDFSRVILNLTNNAFDAMRDKLTGDGGPGTGYVPKLTVRTNVDDGKVTIEIEDNGPGIPDEIKDKIMQPFFTTKKGTQGTGLGLSITNDIVKAHGGTMNIDSQPGQTIFTIKFNR
jgi:signal transduction histidine kinase